MMQMALTVGRSPLTLFKVRGDRMEVVLDITGLLEAVFKTFAELLQDANVVERESTLH